MTVDLSPEVWLSTAAGLLPARPEANDTDLCRLYVRYRDYLALAAENESLADDIARLKDSETHWLNEADRLRAENATAYQRGAEAMRVAALRIESTLEPSDDWPEYEREGYSAARSQYHATIRALPIPDKEATP